MIISDLRISTFVSFKEIIAWERARELAMAIYQHSREGSFRKDFRFRDQICAAEGSVADKIAEGFERDGGKEFVQFLAMAKGSLGEVRSQLCQAFDRGYLSEDRFHILEAERLEIAKLIAGLMNYLRRCEVKGIKYT